MAGSLLNGLPQPATLIAILSLALLPIASGAQEIRVGDLACVPLGSHALVTAETTDAPPRAGARLYFRRMHLEVEDFYWAPMEPAANGQFWVPLPIPEDREMEEQKLRDGQTTETEWADWWLAKESSVDRDPNGKLDTELISERASLGKLETRTWMSNLSAAELQAWLEGLTNEPAEFYAVLYDVDGAEIARSEMKVAAVTKDCDPALDAVQAGHADNEIVGETAAWMADYSLFHWRCDGVVSRIDVADVPRPDQVCRGCPIIPVVVPAVGLIPAAAVAAGTVVGPEVIDPPAPPPEVSPSSPQL